MQMGLQIWNNAPQDMCTFLVKIQTIHIGSYVVIYGDKSLTSSLLGSIVDTMASVSTMYVCMHVCMYYVCMYVRYSARYSSLDSIFVLFFSLIQVVDWLKLT